MTLSVKMMLQSPGLYSIWMSGSNGRSTGSKVKPKSRDRNSRNPPVSETSPVSITWIQHRVELWMESSPRRPQQRRFLTPPRPRLTFPEWSGLMAMPKSVWMKVWLIRWVTSWKVFPWSLLERWESSSYSPKLQQVYTLKMERVASRFRYFSPPIEVGLGKMHHEQRHLKRCQHQQHLGDETLKTAPFPVFLSFTFQVRNSPPRRRPPRPGTANSWSSLWT